MTNEELLSVAEIVERLSARFHKHLAEHEAKMVEHRAAFGARTEADAKIIAGLREERDGLLTQVQDMRAEMARLSAQLEWERAEIKRLQWENATMHKDAEDGYAEAIKVLGDPIALSKERDALRAEVAALQERLRASIARGDFAQMEVAALKSQTPKQSHPVAVGGYLRRLTGFNTTPAGEIARVTLVDDDDASHLEYEVVRPNGEKGRWSAKGCEPCDQPATHDTEAGKAAAESAVRTEPVAEEIKVGDLVEVFQAIGSMTDAEDIGCGGVVRKVDGFFVWLNRTDTMGLPREGIASLGDVRKVTT